MQTFYDLNAPRSQDRNSDKLIDIQNKLEGYLSQTSCSSAFSYLFFFNPTPNLTSHEDPIVENILNHLRNGLFDTRGELLLRLSLIDTSKNERLESCVSEIKENERRSSFLASSSQEAIALFLNAFHYRTWDLSNVFNPALFKEIESLSILLQKKISALQSHFMLDSYRADYFIQYIDAYLACLSQANDVFLIGSVIERNKPFPAVQDHLVALINALETTQSFLPLKEQKIACCSLIRRAGEISFQRLSPPSENDTVMSSPKISLKF